jgi:hypothetical protein
MEQESKQDGVIKEQPKEEISKVVPEALPVEKATSTKAERSYSETEFRKLQSMKDKADAKAKSVEGELQQIRGILEQQRLEQRKKELEALADDPDGQSKVRLKHQLEDEVKILTEKKEKEEDAVGRKYDQALDLDATTPKEMELMAKLKTREHEKSVEKEKTGFKPDSATSDFGGESDEAFIKSYSEGKSSDHKRARKILYKK